MKFLDLVNAADDKRDLNWEDQFLQAFVEQKIELLSLDPQVGPDGFPYLMLKTEDQADLGSPNVNLEPAQKVIQWVAERGIGLAINPHKNYPDFILTFGMLWSFRETGKFIHRNVTEKKGDKIAAAGAPTSAYLPESVRKILRQFLLDQGIIAPKIIVLSDDIQNHDLAFSLEAFGNPPESEWEGIAEALSWFLPPHYSIMLISEKGLPSFVNL